VWWNVTLSPLWRTRSQPGGNDATRNRLVDAQFATASTTTIDVSARRTVKMRASAAPGLVRSAW
jgi:hypothetical protein